MNDSAQQIVEQVEPIEHKQADTDFANNAQQATQKPLVIAGTSDGLLFLDTRQHVELEGYSITALASSPDELWAISDRNSVWHRNSNGEWHKVASINDLQLNCILPYNGAVLVGTSGACLIRIADGSTNRINCFETVEGRDEWYTPWGGPPDVRSMAVGQSGELYVNVHVGGILRSDDQGQSWQPTIDFHADVHEVRTVPGRPDLVLAATAQGLAISKDRGNSWSFDRTNLHAAYARAVAVCGETILMTASTGPHGGKAAIYRHPLDKPGAFEKCEQGLPEWFNDNINTGTLATSLNLAAFGTSDGQIFLSNDAGLTWRQIAGDLAPICRLNLM
ncbi:MAG: glycoside hydrolase [Iphinoe sp. HA4291-MV1]|nr:glycoside hydrolase [Iphinoe sp. HA4291-MV1]